MTKLILKCGLSLGDIVMLTAAVRDLHKAHPGEFLTDVRTPFPSLWENNPYITKLEDTDPTAIVIDCHYPLINKCNQVPYHCLHGFASFLSDFLRLNIPLTAFSGDIHISDLEKSWMSQVHELTGEDTPFWIVVCGGKFDVTIKWWDTARYQKVVDHFRGRLQFVQVGDKKNYHPRLNGAIDLRGKTNVRQLIRLVYHAQGVLCPVTSLMHLAAAIPFKSSHLQHRPAVVVAGGREPAHWEAYPHHQFLHTNGALPCCRDGGCWKARTTPLHDGDDRDKSLCSNVTNGLPACMDLITAEEVIRRISLFFDGGALSYLDAAQGRAASVAVERTHTFAIESGMLEVPSSRSQLEQYIGKIPNYPNCYAGRGIVICAGGLKYFTCAWVNLKLLRHLGCHLPIELWHLGEPEITPAMQQLLAPLHVKCVDALEVRKAHPVRTLGGWELKPFAILHCSFQHVLLLDADNTCLVDPSFLFETDQYAQSGAIFWPDYRSLAPGRSIWHLCGVSFREEPEFETGQIVIDKKRCWKSLNLTMWMNENSDFFYQHIHGDKDTFHMAFRKLNAPYVMPSTPIHSLQGVMCQHDFQARRIFQHRNSHKWSLFGENERIPDFFLEDLCLRFLDELRSKWDGSLESSPP